MIRLLVLGLLACSGGKDADDRSPAGDADTDADTDTDVDTALPVDTGPFPEPEICDDGEDNDLDLNVDCADPDCFSTCDADGDGVVGTAHGGLDCDDGDPAVHPLATEVCDGKDDDCDGKIDGDDPSLDPTTALPRFEDVDGDGFGATVGLLCEETYGWVADGGDCDEANTAINPGAQEICDGGIDNDCDLLADDADPSVDPATMTGWWADVDHDDYGDPNTPVQACADLATVADNPDDCDDGDRRSYPGATETCGDGIDQDCSGADC